MQMILKVQDHECKCHSSDYSIRVYSDLSQALLSISVFPTTLISLICYGRKTIVVSIYTNILHIVSLPQKTTVNVCFIIK